MPDYTQYNPYDASGLRPYRDTPSGSYGVLAERLNAAEGDVTLVICAGNVSPAVGPNPTHSTFMGGRDQQQNQKSRIKRRDSAPARTEDVPAAGRFNSGPVHQASDHPPGSSYF